MRASTAADFGQVRALLAGAGLPVEDLDTAPGLRFWVAEDGDELIGAIGLEQSGTAGLLRSLVVAPAYRKRGLARSLVAAVEREAVVERIEQLVLLTQTAEAFFSALGYHVVDRAYVPDEIKESAEFRSLCPASALCMTKSILSQKPPAVADA
jgi:N-acetylglutamate synthase-like GNAT family acetyltransferase